MVHLIRSMYRTYLSGFISPFLSAEMEGTDKSRYHKDIIFMMRKVSNWKTILSTS